MLVPLLIVTYVFACLIILCYCFICKWAPSYILVCLAHVSMLVYCLLLAYFIVTCWYACNFTQITCLNASNLVHYNMLLCLKNSSGICQTLLDLDRMSRNFANPRSLDYLFINYICTKLTLCCDTPWPMTHLNIQFLLKGAFSPDCNVNHTSTAMKLPFAIPFLAIARLQSQSPHSCVCERFIYSQDRSTYFMQQNNQIDGGKI